MTRNEQVDQAIQDVYEREKAFGDALKREADAEYAFKVKQAQELLNAEGTESVKKSIALTKCSVEYKEYLMATASKEFIKAKLNDAQSVLSARQSLLSAEAKSDFGYANSRRNV